MNLMNIFGENKKQNDDSKYVQARAKSDFDLDSLPGMDGAVYSYEVRKGQLFDIKKSFLGKRTIEIGPTSGGALTVDIHDPRFELLTEDNL